MVLPKMNLKRKPLNMNALKKRQHTPLLFYLVPKYYSNLNEDVRMKHRKKLLTELKGNSMGLKRQGLGKKSLV